MRDKKKDPSWTIEITQLFQTLFLNKLKKGSWPAYRKQKPALKKGISEKETTDERFGEDEKKKN